MYLEISEMDKIDTRKWFLDVAAWNNCSTVHTVLDSTLGHITISEDVIFDISFWIKYIQVCIKYKKLTNKN